MKINVGEWIIEGNHGDWSVSRTIIGTDPKKKNYQKESQTDYNYFGRLYQCLMFLLDAQLADGQKSSIRQLTNEIRTIAKHLKCTVDKIEWAFIEETKKNKNRLDK